MGILSFDSVSKNRFFLPVQKTKIFYILCRKQKFSTQYVENRFFYQCRKQKFSTYYVENKCRKQEFSTYYVENKNFLHSMQKTRIFYIVCRKFLFSTLVNHEKYKFLCGKLKMSVGKIFPTVNVARIVIEKGSKKCRKFLFPSQEPGNSTFRSRFLGSCEKKHHPYLKMGLFKSRCTFFHSFHS